MEILIIILILVGVAVFAMMRAGKSAEQNYQSAPVGFSPKATIEPTAVTQLRLIPSTFDPDGDATDLIWHCLTFEAQDGSRVSYDDRRLTEIGCGVFNVAGVSYRKVALQRECFGPGHFVALVCEDNNPYDKNAVAVWDESRSTQVGYVPKANAKTLRKAIQGGDGISAITVAESRKSNKRIGLTVLYGPLAGLLSR
jgi:hypothetical protein